MTESLEKRAKAARVAADKAQAGADKARDLARELAIEAAELEDQLERAKISRGEPGVILGGAGDVEALAPEPAPESES